MALSASPYSVKDGETTSLRRRAPTGFPVVDTASSSTLRPAMDPHDLYGLPLDRFVAERSALAKALRREGRREEAAEVATLRKPSVAAWAVNQLVRTQRREVASLFEAGDALQRAHCELLAGGGDGDLLREAMARERDAVSGLAEKATGLLSSQGHELTPTTLERVSETLHAAALDQDARAQVRDGCVHRELRHVGLGSSAVAEARPSRVGRTPRRGDRNKARQLEAARKAETDARRVAGRAARELQAAQDRRDRAADSLREAEDALRSARARAEETAAAHRRAADALDRSSRSD